MSWGFACCPVDGEPLISTFERPKKEFVCIVCGAYWEFLQPHGSPETPELQARYEELLAQFKAERTGATG